VAFVLPLHFHLRQAQGGDEMGTIWGSGKSDSNKQVDAGKQSAGHQSARKQVARIGRDAGLRWTRAQRFSTIACFVLLGVLMAVSACSKEDSKPALAGVGVSGTNSGSSATQAIAQLTPSTAGSNQQVGSAAVTPKKPRRKLAANVTYSDANSGVSFVYPRKAALASAEKQTADADGLRIDDLPMNFVQSGGAPVATVALPRSEYAGTDFAGALFRVNVNHSLSAEECPHFAFVDTSDPDGEPIDAEKVKVGSTEMQMTSEFAGDASKQLETRYYHNYAGGACYEYVLGLSTSGFGQEGVHAVDRDQVFGRLEKILATVKIHPIAEGQVAQKQEAPKEDAQKQVPVEAAAVPDSDK
jgi:hypothetical protein